MSQVPSGKERASTRVEIAPLGEPRVQRDARYNGRVYANRNYPNTRIVIIAAPRLDRNSERV